MSQHYNQSYLGQVDALTDGIFQRSQQGCTSVNDMDTEAERSGPQNGNAGDSPPISHSEETADTEAKKGQNGDVKQENHMEDKPKSNAQPDGDVPPVPTNMEE